MGQYLSWLANSVLFVVCCYLLADTTNEVFAALLTPEPVEGTGTPVVVAAPKRTWAEREIILERNLFNASLLAPPREEAPPEEENLAATKLPLKLLGTAAAIPIEDSWAAVVDESQRRTVVVSVGDELSRATVKRIERRRLVLLEGGKLRELVLDENAGPAAPNQRVAARGRGSKGRARTSRKSRKQTSKPPEKVKKLDDDRYQVNRGDVNEVMANPANLFSQARILPKYDDGAMVGLQINAIKPGSLFEEIGIQNGDVITKLNDIVINDPKESAKVLTEFSEAENFSVEVERQDGSSDTLEFNVDE